MTTAHYTSVDTPSNVINSSYKWLSSTLQIAQQGPAFSPQFNMKIIDDSIVPNQILSANNLTFGKAVNAPDGSILATAVDNLGYLRFYKTTDASSAFPSGTIISNLGSRLGNSSIAVSDWINGSYVIDIYCYISISQIIHNRSYDGGVTWTSYTLNPTPTSTIYFLSAGKPILNPLTGIVQGVVFYIRDNVGGVFSTFNNIYYQQYTTGTSFNSEVMWNRSVNSQDWNMHSLDNIYYNGSYHIVFAGFHNWFDTQPTATTTPFSYFTTPIYSLYHTQIDNLTGLDTTDVWHMVTKVFVAESSSVLNLNSFTYPQISYDGTTFFLIFNAVVVEGSTDAPATFSSTTITNNYYYEIQSADMTRFSYPVPIYSATGVVYADTRGVSLVPQSGFYYLLGNGQNWQFIKNNTVADITNYVIDYDIQEMAGSASGITITLANQNNQWIGASPTLPGYQAITSNKKIYVEQGYKTSVGNEVVPRCTFYIDNITLNSSSNQMTATITGRDINKAFKTTITKFNYEWEGPSVYSDIFDGSTTQNWTQTSGGWSEKLINGQGRMTVTTSTAGGGNTNPIIQLSSVLKFTESSITFSNLWIQDAYNFGSGEQSYAGLYTLLLDQNNYFGVNIYINASNQTVAKQVQGINGIFSNGPEVIISSSALNGYYFPVFIRRYDYFTYDILIGKPTASDTLSSYTYNALSQSHTIVCSGFKLDSYFTTGYGNQLFQETPAIQYQMNDPYTLAGIYFEFSFFKFLQFNNSLSLVDAMKYLGTLCGINNYKEKYLLENNANYLIPPGLAIMSAQYKILGNYEVEFMASVIPNNTTDLYGISFIFGSADYTLALGKYYNLNIYSVGGITQATLTIALSDQSPSVAILCPGSMIQYGYTSSTYSNIRFDITKTHTYKFLNVNQTFYLFIDDICSFIWNDLNTTENGVDFSNGYWGFQANTNSNVKVKNIKVYQVYQQTPTLTVSPGDDISSTLSQAMETGFVWTYVDQMNRYIGTVLQSTDVSTYTYQNTAYQYESDNSDQVSINEVVVTGANGISATAKNIPSIVKLGQVRTTNVQDFTITTYADALTRAEQILGDTNKMNNQNTPTNPMNVGSELFDVVTIDDNGNNSSGVNGVYRIYNEELQNAGSKGQFSIQVETGTIS